MPERLSYTDFIEEFLIACAVVMNRNTAVLIDTDLAADYITKDFEKSWPDAAVKQLANNGLLRGSYIVSKPTRYNLTGEGLTYAERLVEDQGKNLADLTDAYAQAMRQEESGQAIKGSPSPSSRIARSSAPTRKSTSRCGGKTCLRSTMPPQACMPISKGHCAIFARAVPQRPRTFWKSPRTSTASRPIAGCFKPSALTRTCSNSSCSFRCGGFTRGFSRTVIAR